MKKNIISVLIQFILIIPGYAQDIWTPTQGPWGLELSDFLISSNDLWVASATSDGIYFSQDKGTTWSKRSRGLYKSNSYASDLASAPDGTIYALIEDELYFMNPMTSEWEKTIFKFPNSVVQVGANGYVCVLSQLLGTRIYVSKDRAESFQLVYQNNMNLVYNLSFNGNDNNFFVTSESSDYYLFRFADNGSEIKPLRKSDPGFNNLLWHPSGKLLIFEFTGDMYRLDRDGKQEKYNKNLPFYYHQVFIKPDGSMLALGRYQDYVSLDLGNKWIAQSTKYYEGGFDSQLFFAKDHPTVSFKKYCNVKSLQSTTDNGTSWFEHDPSFKNLSYSGLISNDATNSIITKNCNGNEIQYTLDEGSSWKKIKLPETTNYTLHANQFGRLFLSALSSVLFSDDLGINWEKLEISQRSNLRKLISDRGKTLLVWGIENDFISIDGGQTWNPINESPGFSNEHIITHPDGYLYCYTKIPSNNEIYVSGNHGINWEKIYTPFDFFYTMLILKDSTMLVSAKHATTGSWGLFSSKDKLNTFSKISNFNPVNIIEDNSGNLYGYNYNSACFISKDKGKTWTAFSSGLPVPERNNNNIFIEGLAIDANQNLFIALKNNIVYKTANPVSSVKNYQSDPDFHLLNNISDQTIVLGTNSEKSEINTYMISDQLGRILMTDHNPLLSGSHLKLDIHHLKPGMYYLIVNEKSGNSSIHKFIKI